MPAKRKPTLDDLLAELDALGLRPVQDGEITAPMFAAHKGCTHNTAINFLRRQEKEGKLTPLSRRGPNGRRVLAWARAEVKTKR